MKKIIALTLPSLLLLGMLLAGCEKPKPQDAVTIEKTASGEIIHVAQQPQQNNNDVIWYMFWYHMLFSPSRGDTVNNYYSRPSQTWTQRTYEDNSGAPPAAPAPVAPAPSYDPPDTNSYDDSFWDSTPSYSDSFWDSTPSYDSFDSGPSYSDSFWDSGGFSGGSTGGGYSDSFWE